MKNESWLWEEDWSVVTGFLPSEWQEKAKELGAFCYIREFPDPGALLRALLIHVVDGCSFRETAVRAKQSGIADVSDVALIKRLRKGGEWLRWMAQGVMQRWLDKTQHEIGRGITRIRIIDGTTIQEPGSKGTSWRLHYSIDLRTLSCDEFAVTGPKEGETFKNFAVSPGDLFMGDRCYANASAVAYVVDGGGHVLVRAKTKGLSLVDSEDHGFELLRKLRTLQVGEVGDWDVWVQHGDRRIKGRICAVKKTSCAAEAARRKITREHNKKHGTKRQLSPTTLEAAGYFFVFTTLERTFTAEEILEIYGARWQVELAFKRLKSILRVGQLHNKNPASARAWLHGKILIAFLVTAIIMAGRSFFPWGYPVYVPRPTHP
ncbi:MAG: IS4 family transposase [Pseudomonadota bacterium]